MAPSPSSVTQHPVRTLLMARHTVATAPVLCCDPSVIGPLLSVNQTYPAGRTLQSRSDTDGFPEPCMKHEDLLGIEFSVKSDFKRPLRLSFST
ncbi:hypothetical protein FE257_006862 [Aspergillus nanangensis]|uniref:Uncharacterized protein n=1 Tax=Aspergillus nanangensis TaxID=2582783 RepID=A0AAD4CQA2_ASPNN|nr:hypothetical protein FE257_006862 [Aspergillus nanangensis]